MYFSLVFESDILTQQKKKVNQVIIFGPLRNASRSYLAHKTRDGSFDLRDAIKTDSKTDKWTLDNCFCKNAKFFFLYWDAEFWWFGKWFAISELQRSVELVTLNWGFGCFRSWGPRQFLSVLLETCRNKRFWIHWLSCVLFCCENHCFTLRIILQIDLILIHWSIKEIWWNFKISN